MHPVALDAVLDSLLEGLQVLSPDWRYLHVNEAAARHGRTQPGALLGHTIHECYPGIATTAVFALMQEVMTSRRPRAFENEFVFPDGSRGHFELRIEPVPQGICVLSIDVTERKHAEHMRTLAEERLRDVLRLESVGRLAAGLAHDFNNLLTVVIGQCQLALARPGGPLADDLAAVLAAGQSAALLTRGLLAFGRRPGFARRDGDVGLAVDELAPLLQRAVGPRIELGTAVATGPHPVAIEPFQVEQILVNLVLNARDAILGAGRIDITVERVEAPCRGPSANRPGAIAPHLCLAVTDSGIGMAQETIARIFDPSFTTKEPGRGTGLGLVAVQDIVSACDGYMQVSSQPRRGSAFRVFLPLDRARVPSSPAALPAPGERPRQASILLVDDMPEVADLMRRILALGAHSVLVARSGREALELLAAHRTDLDLLVTDMTLGDMSGLDVVERVRQGRPGLPIVCTSGHGGVAKQRLLQMAHVDWLDKPFTPDQLLRVVARALAPDEAAPA